MLGLGAGVGDGDTDIVMPFAAWVSVCRDGFCVAELDTTEFHVYDHHHGKTYGKGSAHGAHSHFHMPVSQCLFGYEQGADDDCTALETSCAPCDCWNGPGSPGKHNRRHRFTSCIGTPPGVIEANLSPLGPFELLRQSGQWANRKRSSRKRARLVAGLPTPEELAFLADHLGDTCSSFCGMQVSQVGVA